MGYKGRTSVVLFVVFIFRSSFRFLAWKGIFVFFFSCWVVSVVVRRMRVLVFIRVIMYFLLYVDYVLINLSDKEVCFLGIYI